MTTVKTSRVLMGAIIAASLLGGLVGPPGLAAQGSLGDTRSSLASGRTLPILLGSAHLTAEQRTQVQAILASRRAGIRALIRDVQQAQDELADKLLTPGSLQLGDVQPQLSKIGTLRDRLLQDSAQVTLEIRALLTPEQISRAGLVKDKLRQLRSEVQQLLRATEP
jgi:Spy/CpxP family protein refolding chaperone